MEQWLASQAALGSWGQGVQDAAGQAAQAAALAQAAGQAADPSSIDQLLAAQWASAMQPGASESLAQWGQQVQQAATAVQQWGQQQQQAQAAAGGKGKVVMPPGQQSQAQQQWAAHAQSDAIIIAINTAMQAVGPDELISTNEGAWDVETLKKRLSKYFRSAAKGLNTAGPYEKVINDYADAALGNVSWALQGTKWLGKADFTLVLEVAISELFPESFKEKVPQGAAFEEAILQAHDRALEEARFSPVLMDTVKEIVEGKKAQNKVFNAAEAARRKIVTKMLENKDDSAEFFDIAENGLMGKIEEFARDWITTTMSTFGDWPEGVLDRADCQRLFQKLLANEDCVLPRTLVRYMVEPLPDPWDFVAQTVKAIYDAADEANAANEVPKKKKRNTWAEGPNLQYKTTRCTNILETGTCRMGEWCVFAHSDEELAAHQWTAMQMKGMMKGMKGKMEAMGGGGMEKGCGKKGGPGQYAYPPTSSWGPAKGGKDMKGWGCKGKWDKGGKPYSPYMPKGKGKGSIRPAYGKGAYAEFDEGAGADPEEEEAWEALAASFEAEAGEGEEGEWELNEGLE